MYLRRFVLYKSNLQLVKGIFIKPYSTIKQNDINQSKKVDSSDDVQQRLSKILQDIPQSDRLEKKEIDYVLNNSNPVSEESDNISTEESKQNKDAEQRSNQSNQNNRNDNKQTYSYSDIFNIQQIIDTVKASENVKLLQTELSEFYANKRKTQKELNETLSKTISHNVKELKSSIGIASKVVNEITGYNKVIKLKDVIDEYDNKLKELKKEIHAAKAEHERSLELRSSSQKEVNELLERKNSWNPVDLERFTKIYLTTHDLDKSVKDSSKRLNDLEKLQETTHDNLIKSIMNRYHEEQIWSDKIRQFSTWGTILIMCINLVLILLVQFVFEPFKRWRLVNSFEGKVKELFSNSEKLDLDIQELRNELTALNNGIKLSNGNRNDNDNDNNNNNNNNNNSKYMSNESQEIIPSPIINDVVSYEPPYQLNKADLQPFQITSAESIKLYTNYYLKSAYLWYDYSKFWAGVNLQKIKSKIHYSLFYLTTSSNSGMVTSSVGDLKFGLIISSVLSALIGLLVGITV
ncbi:She9 protein [Pichia kluyveri]|uniref:Sensitive to high expression protein 9, mitochondrial n=1 Tax=Pichia kluyveri TaxID=36015 RepID=A0AAV5R5N1_PICKL|nr:She9 protein [Pichia kluyveri]